MPRRYIRCDYFIVAHRNIVYVIIQLLSNLKNSIFHRSKITRGIPTDLRTDTTYYRVARTHLTSPIGQRCVLKVLIALEYILDVIHFLMISGDLGIFFQNTNGHTDGPTDGHTLL